MTLEQAFELAVQHYHANELPPAETLCQQILQIKPSHSDAWHLLGIIAAQLKKYDTAVELLQKAIRINYSEPSYYDNLGLILTQQGKFGEAIACYQRAIALNPNDVKVHHHLGTVLMEQRNFAEAEKSYRNALKLAPESSEIELDLGNVLRYQGKLEGAIECYQHVLTTYPNHAAAHNNLACLLNDKGDFKQARQHWQTTLTLRPDYAEARSNFLLGLNYQEEDPATLYFEHQQFQQHHVASLGTSQVYANDRNPHRKLKIGYLSQDFRRHSVAYFLEPILAHHDHDQFEIYCYYNNVGHDEVTRRFMKYADHWRHCVSLPDHLLTQGIQQDQIDILVDLMGHTGKNRMMVFAHKPVPLQITYLGYPTTTGLSAIDYRLTDSYVDPEGVSEKFNAEKLLRLPHSYFCYFPADETAHAQVNELPALCNGYITFGSFNNYTKVSSKVRNLWVKILQAVPQSKLFLKSSGLHFDDPQLRQRVERQFAELGIPPERLILTPHTSSIDTHINTYHEIDIALDTYPYNGATTTCDALWMGVPVVTLVGKTSTARMGLSILSTVGLSELITQTPEEYVNLCVKLANDTNYLQQLRKRLRPQMQASPLMEAPTFTRQLEAIYRNVWETYTASSGEVANVNFANWLDSLPPLTAPAEASTPEIMTLDQIPPLTAGVQNTFWTPTEILQQALQHHQAGDLTLAETLYRQVLATEPNNATALHLLGVAAAQQLRYEEAIRLMNQAIQNNDQVPDFYHSLGSAYGNQNLFAEATDCYRKALALSPQDAETYSNLAYVLRTQGKLEEAITYYQKARELDPENVVIHSDYLFTLVYAAHYRAADIYAEHVKFHQQHAAKLANVVHFPRSPRDPQKRLKIGYVSSDFRKHAVGYFMAPLLTHHSHREFEIFCYYNHFQQDEFTQHFQQEADHWRDCFNWSDEELASHIRADGIDILVDLSCHKRDNRLLVFARKPAPIQVTYLGHPTSTGLKAIDYRLTDGYTDPVGFESLSSEKLARLPDSFYCYRPPQDSPPVGELPALRQKHITFGSFNALIKINSQVIQLWAQILQAVPHSRLLLKTHGLTSAATQQEIVDQFAQLGVHPTRLTLLGWQETTEAHLSMYNQIDISLDSFPYNGGTTTCESLWMGVPVVTLIGDRSVSRMGASLLSVVGCSPWIAQTPQDYVTIAIQLAQNLSSLTSIRAGLRERLKQSALLDEVRFTRNVEKWYRQMWNNQ